MSRAGAVQVRWDAVAERRTMAALRGLRDRYRKAAVRNAVRKAARPMARAAKRGAPKEHGFTRKAIGTRVKTFRDGNVIAVTGVRRGPKFVYSATSKPFRAGDRSVIGLAGRQVKRVPANTAHLVEFGTRPHRLGGGVALGRGPGNRGQSRDQRGAMHPGTPPRPFLGPAYRQTRRECQAIFARTLAEETRRQAMKEAARFPRGARS